MAECRPKNYPKLKDYKPSRFMLPTCHYDAAKADRAVTFIENLRHTKGKWAGKRFWLLPWQEQIIRDVFGIVDEKGNSHARIANLMSNETWIYKDLRQLEKSVGENDEDNSNLDLFSLEMFENLAWLMTRHADPANVPDSPEEFLVQFNAFSIYQILPQLIELWGLNVQTEVESRKNLEKVSGK